MATKTTKTTTTSTVAATTTTTTAVATTTAMMADAVGGVATTTGGSGRAAAAASLAAAQCVVEARGNRQRDNQPVIEAEAESRGQEEEASMGQPAGKQGTAVAEAESRG